MKKQISRILGVVLSLALLSVFFVAAPVSAGIGDDDNAWGAVGMPAIAPETEVGVMAIAPDGTMFVAVFYEDGYSAEAGVTPSVDRTWDIMKSIDGGFNWTATELTGLVDYDGDIQTWDTGGRDQTPVDIVISPNWGYDETLYVACLNGDIFRLEDAGDAAPTQFKDIVDSFGDTPDSTGSFLYDIDVWFDGSDNWIMAACDLDVLVLRDNIWFEEWRDQELATGGAWGWAVQADFAPDFSSSSLIWAVATDGIRYILVSSVAGTATWSTVTQVSGDYSAKLTIPTNYAIGDEAKVQMPLSASGLTLNGINSLSYQYYVDPSTPPTALVYEGFIKAETSWVEPSGAGYAGYNTYGAPYLVIELDADLDGSADTWVVQAKWAANVAGSWQLDNIEATEPFHVAGAATTPGFSIGADWGSLAEIKAAVSSLAPSATLGDARVLAVKVAIGGWDPAGSTPPDGPVVNYVDNISLNGVLYDLEPPFHLTSTISPGQWGNTIKDVVFVNQGGLPNEWTPYVDIAFPDGYTTTAPVLYVAIAENIPFANEGNLYMVQGAYASSTALTEADPLLPADIDVGSVEVSGNVILLVDTWSGDVWVSYNAGDTFALAVRGPSGWFSFWGHVYMAPGAFDPDEGVAYFSSIDYGYGQSAVSRTDDGGATWDQISWVDTYIDYIHDVAFAPEGASQPTLLLTGDDTSSGSLLDSLWQTADATATSPRWVRVATNWNLGVDYIEKVEYALDDSSIMLFVDGAADGEDWEIWKSTDDANTFNHWRNLPATVGYLNDWVVANSATIYTACTGGYYGTSIFGPATLELLGDLNSIAVDGDTIVVGFSADGEIAASTDAGENWGDVEDIGNGAVFVAFGPDGALYAATSASEVQEVTLDGDVVDDSEAVKDSNEDTALADGGFSGIWVSLDNALYAIGEDEDLEQLFRLLIGEVDNVWETADQTDAVGLWGTTGSNILWTVVDDGSDPPVLYALEDTLSGPVTGVAVSGIGETSATVSWSAMVGEDLVYEIIVTDGVDVWGFTDGTLMKLVGLLDDNTEYDVWVRVAPQPTYPTTGPLADSSTSPFSSRWSSVVTFATLEAIDVPDNLVPDNGMQDAPLLPSFVWLEVGNAEYYEFQLSTSPIYSADGFSSTVEVAEITAPTTAYTCTVKLAYDTDHYWIVRAVSTDSVSGEIAYSDWCFSNFHTMVEAIPQVTIEPQPTPTIILPTPEVEVIVNIPDIEVIVEPPDITVDLPTPTITTVHTTIELPPDVAPAYIWVIVAIGALLVIAVIILIIRTRRVV